MYIDSLENFTFISIDKHVFFFSPTASTEDDKLRKM